jgi:hypothetical protein
VGAETIEITETMLNAGERAILEELGGISELFSARDLAKSVYLAMSDCGCELESRRIALSKSHSVRQPCRDSNDTEGE